MKKTYAKPLVYCENNKTGSVVSNSREYAEKMQEKLAKLKESGELICDGSNKRGDVD